MSVAVRRVYGLFTNTGMESGMAGAALLTMCNQESNLALSVPGRWNLKLLTHDQAVREVDRLASILVKGTEALSGLYLRICDTIRLNGLVESEIRLALCKHFPPPRISEFVRIAQAPDEVYRRYRAGFVGFRAALAECRGYRLHSDGWLKQRKIRRAAERLITLMGPGKVEVLGHCVSVE